MTSEQLQKICTVFSKEVWSLVQETRIIMPGFLLVNDVAELSGFIPLDGPVGKLFDSGAGKEVLFSAMREFIAAKNASGIVFISDVFFFRSNLKGFALSEEALRKKVDKGFVTLVREGYGDVQESVSIEAQTPEWTCIDMIPYKRNENGEIVSVEPVISGDVQETSKLMGRAKFFGPNTEIPQETQKATSRLFKERKKNAKAWSGEGGER